MNTYHCSIDKKNSLMLAILLLAKFMPKIEEKKHLRLNLF